MRATLALVWHEMYGLAPMWLILSVVAVASVGSMVSPEPDLEDLSGLAALVGGILGIVHGAVDRKRRRDAFLLHRPISAPRIHATRTAVGLCCVVFTFVEMVAAHAVFTAIDNARLAGLREHGYPGRDDAAHLGLVTILFLGVLIVAAWAVARLISAVPRWPLVLPALLLPALAWSAVFRTGGLVEATGVLALLTTVVVAADVLVLSGERS